MPIRITSHLPEIAHQLSPFGGVFNKVYHTYADNNVDRPKQLYVYTLDPGQEPKPTLTFDIRTLKLDVADAYRRLLANLIREAAESEPFSEEFWSNVDALRHFFWQGEACWHRDICADWAQQPQVVQVVKEDGHAV